MAAPVPLVRIAGRLVVAAPVPLVRIAWRLVIVSSSGEGHSINFEVVPAVYSGVCSFLSRIFWREISLVVVRLVEADPLTLYLFWWRLCSDRG